MIPLSLIPVSIAVTSWGFLGDLGDGHFYKHIFVNEQTHLFCLDDTPSWVIKGGFYIDTGLDAYSCETPEEAAEIIYQEGIALN